MDPTEREIKFSEVLKTLLATGSPSVPHKKLATAIGVGDATISHYVHDRVRPSFNALLGIAAFFNVTLDYLVFGERSASSAARDDSPVTRIELMRAFAESVEHSGRQRDLIIRVNQQLHKEVERIARDLAGTAQSLGPVGTISAPEALAIEACSTHVQVMAQQAPADLTTASDGTVAPGMFFDTMMNNLRRGVGYEYLLYGKRPIYAAYAAQMRNLLREKGVGAETMAEGLSLRHLDKDLISGACVYTVDTLALERREPIMWERFRDNGIYEGKLSFILFRNNEEINGIVTDAGHGRGCQRIFTHDWRLGSAL